MPMCARLRGRTNDAFGGMRCNLAAARGQVHLSRRSQFLAHVCINMLHGIAGVPATSAAVWQSAHE